MELDKVDRAALRDAIQADSTLAKLATDTGYQLIADALNAEAPGPVPAWLTSVSPQKVDEACDWVYFATLDPALQNSWQFFFNYARDFSKDEVQAWVITVWGAAKAGSPAERILLAGTENATYAESLVSGAQKPTETFSALVRKWAGKISVYDIGGILEG